MVRKKAKRCRERERERERERRSGTGENGYRTRIQAGLRTGPSCRWAWHRPDPHSQSRPRGHRYQRHQPVVLKHSKYVPGTVLPYSLNIKLGPVRREKKILQSCGRKSTNLTFKV